MAGSKIVVSLPSHAIEPELREFIDEVLVPALVRGAMADLAEENRLASSAIAIANSPRSANE